MNERDTLQIQFSMGMDAAIQQIDRYVDKNTEEYKEFLRQSIAEFDFNAELKRQLDTQLRLKAEQVVRSAYFLIGSIPEKMLQDQAVDFIEQKILERLQAKHRTSHQENQG